MLPHLSLRPPAYNKWCLGFLQPTECQLTHHQHSWSIAQWKGIFTHAIITQLFNWFAWNAKWNGRRVDSSRRRINSESRELSVLPCLPSAYNINQDAYKNLLLFPIYGCCVVSCHMQSFTANPLWQRLFRWMLAQRLRWNCCPHGCI